MVYLKLQPHIQSSFAVRSNQKLSFRFFGPFRIISRVGAVAYKLDLPATAQIHPVVHVSQLKLHVPPSTKVSQSLDAVATDHTASILPVQVLDVKDIQIGGKLKQRVLIQWEHQPMFMATWEDAADRKRRFHTAWGQAVAKAGDNVTNRMRALKITKRG